MSTKKKRIFIEQKKYRDVEWMVTCVVATKNDWCSRFGQGGQKLTEDDYAYILDFFNIEQVLRNVTNMKSLHRQEFDVERVKRDIRCFMKGVPMQPLNSDGQYASEWSRGFVEEKLQLMLYDVTKSFLARNEKVAERKNKIKWIALRGLQDYVLLRMRKLAHREQFASRLASKCVADAIRCVQDGLKRDADVANRKQVAPKTRFGGVVENFEPVDVEKEEKRRIRAAAERASRREREAAQVAQTAQTAQTAQLAVPFPMMMPVANRDPTVKARSIEEASQHARSLHVKEEERVQQLEMKKHFRSLGHKIAYGL